MPLYVEGHAELQTSLENAMRLSPRGRERECPGQRDWPWLTFSFALFLPARKKQSRDASSHPRPALPPPAPLSCVKY